MRVFKDGNMYKVSRITGPKHNYLGLVLSDSNVPSITIGAVAIGGGTTSGQLKQELVLAAVQEGVAKGNEECGTDLRVATVQYAVDDSADYDAYRLLARMIIESAAQERST